MKKLTDEYYNSFADVIKERGIKLYNNHAVYNLYKSGKNYYAKVIGDSNKTYDVRLTKDKILKIKCTCPYEYNCKHEYAVLMAIDNGDLQDIKLKKNINKVKQNTYDLINRIPAEDLKKYILSEVGRDTVAFNETIFYKQFKTLLNKEKKHYYYNTIYNALSLDIDVEKNIYSFLDDANDYILSKDYETAFNIIRDILEAYFDLNNKKYKYIMNNLYPYIGIYLRTIYRISNMQLCNKIERWIKKVQVKEYYHDLYFMDIIKSIDINEKKIISG